MEEEVNKMKTQYIWTMDLGWRGAIAVVAPDEDSARALMCDALNYNENKKVERHEIVEGFFFVNLGDM